MPGWQSAVQRRTSQQGPPYWQAAAQQDSHSTYAFQLVGRQCIAGPAGGARAVRVAVHCAASDGSALVGEERAGKAGSEAGRPSSSDHARCTATSSWQGRGWGKAAYAFALVLRRGVAAGTRGADASAVGVGGKGGTVGEREGAGALHTHSRGAAGTSELHDRAAARGTQQPSSETVCCQMGLHATHRALGGCAGAGADHFAAGTLVAVEPGGHRVLAAVVTQDSGAVGVLEAGTIARRACRLDCRTARW